MRKIKELNLKIEDLKMDLKSCHELINKFSYENNCLINELCRKDRERKFQEINVEESLNKDKLIELYKPIVHNSKMMAVNELETIKMYILEGEKDIIKLIDKEIEILKGE
jgi:hypothetical protein